LSHKTQLNSFHSFIDSATKPESWFNFSEIVPVKLGCLLLPFQTFSIISFFTPSSPILSSLSSATVKSINLSDAPMTSAIPDNIFLLLILIVTPSKPSAVKQCRTIAPVQLLATGIPPHLHHIEKTL
jgi:hypothetical protein